MASEDWALKEVTSEMGCRHPIRSGSACPGRGRVGAERLAAADTAPESPELTDGVTEPKLRTLPGHLERIEGCAFGVGGQHDGGAIQRHSEGAAVGRCSWRSRTKTVPPGPNRRVRHVELRSDRAQTDVGDAPERDPTPDDSHAVEPSRQHEVR